jgi:hypothetical protein
MLAVADMGKILEPLQLPMGFFASELGPCNTVPAQAKIVAKS